MLCCAADSVCVIVQVCALFLLLETSKGFKYHYGAFKLSIFADKEVNKRIATILLACRERERESVCVC